MGGFPRARGMRVEAAQFGHLTVARTLSERPEDSNRRLDGFERRSLRRIGDKSAGSDFMCKEKRPLASGNFY
jgi:hypothetical protein